MDNLTRIETGLEAGLRVGPAAMDQRASGLRSEAASSAENFQSLVSRLETFRTGVGSRVPMCMEQRNNGTSLVFCIGSSMPMLAKPAYSFRISAGAGDRAFMMTERDEDTFFMAGLSLEEVVENLAEFVAAEIEKPHPYGFPEWLTGRDGIGAQAVAMVSFFGAWMLIGATGGIWGVLFGWAPAAMVGWGLGVLWLLLVPALISLLIRK